jgi:predicted nucleotidyltransferase
VKYEVRDGKAYYDGRTLAEWVPDLVTRLVEGFSPERVILFGSVARGDDGPDSDIDLLVVLDSLDYGARRQLTSSMLASLPARPPLQIFVTDVRECERRRDVVGSIHYWPLREGRVLYERAA